MQPVSMRSDLPCLQFALQQGSSRMHERPPVSLQTLHDESFTAKQAGPELPLESDTHAHALCSRQKGILLGNQFAADFRQMDRNDLPRIRRAKRQLPLPIGAIQENCHEQRLARQQPLACAHQGAEKSAVLLRAIAEDGLHFDPVFHVHHPAGFGHRRFSGIQFDLDELHIAANNLIINLVHCGHGCLLQVLIRI